MFNLVAQKDDFGCGVACVASRLGLSYQDTLKLFRFPEKAKTKGCMCKELAQALEKEGIKYRLRFAPKTPIEVVNLIGTIVFIKRSDSYPYGHYLLKTESGWMDPWYNLPKNKNIGQAFAKFRNKLPGEPLYVLVEIT